MTIAPNRLTSTLLAVVTTTGFATVWSAEDVGPWSADDTRMLASALVHCLDREYREALALVAPLARTAPFRKELLSASADLPLRLVPPGFQDQVRPVTLLAHALLGIGQYSQYCCVSSAISYHDKGAPLAPESVPLLTAKRQVGGDVRAYALALAVNDLWVDFDFTPALVLREQCLFVALAQLAPHLGFEAETAKGQTRIELRRQQAPTRLLFVEGKKEVRAQGVESFTLEHAPFTLEGVLMVPAAEVAKLLKGEVHWYPEVRFMHLIIPKVPGKPAEQ